MLAQHIGGLLLTLAALAGAADTVFADDTLPAGSSAQRALRVVSTANPNLFPLLIALGAQPDLNVEIVPVASNRELVAKLKSGQGDVLLAMTYAAAQLASEGRLPALHLIDVDLWSGFYILAEQSSGITSVAQLAHKGVLVSGPVAGGEGGGPDLIFQAAIRKAGLSPAEMHLCYLPVMQAVPMLIQQSPMRSSSNCEQDNDGPPEAISLVEPAATGAVMQSRMSSSSHGALVKAIDIQTLFGPYSTWPRGQLPHGGISVTEAALRDPERARQIEAFLEAYHRAVKRIMSAKGRPLAMIRVARQISSGVEKYFGQFGLSLPPSVFMASMRSGDLIYSNEHSVTDIHDDLTSFLDEVVGTPIPATFITHL